MLFSRLIPYWVKNYCRKYFARWVRAHECWAVPSVYKQKAVEIRPMPVFPLYSNSYKIDIELFVML
jgi:hypothetical protein